MSVRLLSVKYLGMAEIYIRRIAQNVPILMIFSQIFPGACHSDFAPVQVSFTIGHSTSKIDVVECYTATGRGVDRSGRSRVNELLNE